MVDFKKYANVPGEATVSGVPEAFDAKILIDILDACESGAVIFIARDEIHMVRMAKSLEFFTPKQAKSSKAAKIVIHQFPAWDCLPYDRVSPLSDIVAQRLTVLASLANCPLNSPNINNPNKTILLTTINGAQQRVPAKESLKGASLELKTGGVFDEKEFFKFLNSNGYYKRSTVREAGEFAVRGGIIDIFPPSVKEPVRLDLFGDEIERIRYFDPVNQRSRKEKVDVVLFQPVSEVILTDDNIKRFRKAYRQIFGSISDNDNLFEAISTGRRYVGMEHWLSLFHDNLDSIFDYLADATIILDYQAKEALGNRFAAIDDYYNARVAMMGANNRHAAGEDQITPLYNALPPRFLYLSKDEWHERLSLRPVLNFTPFIMPDSDEINIIDAGGRMIDDFSEARANPSKNLFDAFSERLIKHKAGGGNKSKKIIIAAYSEGSKSRLASLMSEHGLAMFGTIDDWRGACLLENGDVAFCVFEMERGFETDSHIFYSEQDILGERLARAPKRRKRRGEEFITEAAALDQGDLVVHLEHGIGRYDGLETLSILSAPHDCLRILYLNNDKLFVPVENIDILSRYGSENAKAQLDKLGGVAWQARKAKIKGRIKDIADKLLKIAAERELRKGDIITPPDGLYDEFCVNFPFVETEDQLQAVADILDDMASGRPMDRLICGDVGFGKTEVALRAAFVTALGGQQVAVVVPTTLLARQHFKNFCDRFNNMPVKIRQLSRLVKAKDATITKKGMADGTVDIIIGTHALLAKATQFKNLGLLIIDEEQHFGVTQKERLKQLKTNVHVLSLSATPIPRTLQMALSGVREMTIMATPPVDRLAIRTFILPYDPVVLREAIMREHYRGGQVFYVCPRVADLGRMRKKLKDLVPEIKIATAHGQMTPSELEDVMEAFMDGQYDLLLATNIIESGLDIPTANTMIMHRSDMYGLSQLYQLRGRIGRGKIRAYCYLTVPPGKILSPSAKKRLEVMQTLDSLGAGFSLASHDLDIRGAGILLGDKQSGHIKEVGVELYQRMLEEAVVAAKDDVMAITAEGIYSPIINIGCAVLIPEEYVSDLSVRFNLYRRISSLINLAEIDAFAVEIVDRFGALPDEDNNLLRVFRIKHLFKIANIEKLDAGPKGAVITFRNDKFPNPLGLIGLLQQQLGSIKLRPDQKLVIQRPWEELEKRMSGVINFMRILAKLAKEKDKI